MTELRLENVTQIVDDKILLHDISFQINETEFTAIIGPNGAGKTSLIQLAAGIKEATLGTIQLGEHPIAEIKPLERAKQIAYLPQLRPLAWPMRVRDVVALGRFAFGAPISNLSGDDVKAVDGVMKNCELTHLADRSVETLSGGELARVHIARALAAAAPLLLVDEPTTALDPRLQFKVMSLIRQYVESGATSLAIVHDISLAAKFADRLIWMKAGKIVADGPPSETITSERLRDVFRLEATVHQEEEKLAITIDGIT